MNGHERLDAVLHRRKPDKVPFAPYDEMVPRGSFERELRNRGMVLWTFRTVPYWSEFPNVTFETRVEGDRVTTIAHTPVGSVSSWYTTHLSRTIARERSNQGGGWIKSVEDYDPVIFMIGDELFHPDHEVFDWISRDLGGDGHVRVQSGLGPPYTGAYGYYGMGTPDGLPNYVYAPLDFPDHYARLIAALERRNRRVFDAVADCPAEVFNLGDVSDYYGPKQFREQDLPFYEEYVPLLHARGKILTNHAHSSHLQQVKDLIPMTGLDVIDAFTPPPVGNLSLAEARAAWGDRVIIGLNFPESIFWEPTEEVKAYTLDLLRSDPGGPLIITLTEMGISMLADDMTEQAFKAGMRAIMDAIDEYSSEGM